jgi:hypothetical protein
MFGSDVYGKPRPKKVKPLIARNKIWFGCGQFIAQLDKKKVQFAMIFFEDLCG